MSCNTKTSLAAVIDAVNAQLNNNYIDRDDPRINQGVFTEPTIRGGLMLDEAAKLDFCGYVTECGQREPFGKQWVDRPLYPHNTLVSYEDGGEVKSHWQDTDDVVAGTEIGESYTAYEETRSLGLQGYTIIDSFELGATITQRDQVLRHAATGNLYRWAGDLPKIVPVGSTPDSDGGVGTNAWLGVSDTALRQDILTGGLLTDAVIKTVAPVGGIERTQQDRNSDLVSVKDYGVIGSINEDQSQLVQNYYDINCLNGRTPYMYFPTFNEEYLFNSPVYMRAAGIKIFGHKGVGYNKNYFGGPTAPWVRAGNIVVNTSHAFDLGAERETTSMPGGPAMDGWTVSNLGFRQKEGLPVRSADAIRITSKQNSPDRPFLFNELTVTEMNAGITSPFVAGLNTVGCVVTTRSCNFSGNNYGVKFDSVLYGATFKDSIIEHNKLGGIWGDFDCYLNIDNCLIEGQPNAINIYHHDPNTVSITKTRIQITNNYVESNSGEYIINYNQRESTNGYLIVRGNVGGGSSTQGGTDLLRIENARLIRVEFDAIEGAITLMHDSVISPDSVITSAQFPYFKVRKTGLSNNSIPSRGCIVYDNNYYNKPHRVGENIVNMPVTDGKYEENSEGVLEYLGINTYLSSEKAIVMNEGDLIVFNIILKIDTVTDTTSVRQEVKYLAYDSTNSGILEWSTIHVAKKLVGQKMLATIVGRARADYTGIVKFSVRSADGVETAKVYGGSVENYGYFTNDGTETKDVYPNPPRLTSYKKVQDLIPSYEVSIPAGGTFESTINGSIFRSTDSLVAHIKSYHVSNQYIVIEKAQVVNSTGAVKLTFRNNTQSPLNIGLPTIKVYSV